MISEQHILSLLQNYFSEFLIASDIFLDQPTNAISLDYGFDFNEQELGDELLAHLPANISSDSAPLIAAEEFDSLYKWFIS